MDKEKILQCLYEVAEADEKTISSIKESTDLSELGIDSLKLVSLIVELEERLGIEILDSDLIFEKFETVERMFSTLSKYFDAQRDYKKCLILDCDNVLWKGISGEEDITVDGDVLRIHGAVAELYRHGALLCLCTKNEESNINDAFSKIRMLDLKKHFIISKLNCTDKAADILEISRELALPLDSFVFVDDSDYELGYIKESLPEVTAIKADYESTAFIGDITCLFADNIASELNRTELYRMQKEREKEKHRHLSIQEYNESLNTQLTCKEACKDDIPRLAELSARTHQLNLSDRHYTEGEICGMLSDGEHSVISLSAKDRYGDMGIVGMAVILGNVIEAFMLSCRVFDRGFELVLLDRARALCSGDVCGRFVPNGKNARFASFYEENGVRSI